MDYKEFLQTLKKGLEEHFGESKVVKHRKVTKTNLGEIDTLLISQKAEDAYSSSPAFYVRNYFQQYKDGQTMDELVQEIAEIYEMNPVNVSAEEMEHFLQSYEEIKDKIYFRLVNTGKNQLMLEKIPHFEHLDFTMVFHILVVTDAKGIGSMRITDDMLIDWGISPEELRSHAIENTEKLFPARIEDMDSAIRRIIKSHDELAMELEPLSDGVCKKENPFVLSNQQGINGFSVVFYRDCLKDVAKQVGQNLFVIPSSVHEALLFPDTGDKEQPQILREMVRSVNKSSVSEEDFMSDEVYYYDAEKDILQLAEGGGDYV